MCFKCVVLHGVLCVFVFVCVLAYVCLCGLLAISCVMLYGLLWFVCVCVHVCVVWFECVCVFCL